MKTRWAGSLGLALGLLVAAARADEPSWRRSVASTGTPAVVLERPVPAATLERPVPWSSAVIPTPVAPAVLERPIVAVSYSSSDLAPRVFRGQIPDAGGAPPPPLPASPAMPAPTSPGPILPPPNEPYNCGVVNTPPPTGFWDKCKGLFSWCHCPEFPKITFQSDQAFPGFISPVSNPFLFEDPLALTEVKPIFMWQGTPSSNGPFHGGDIEYFGLQARVAVTERLSFVMSELGMLWTEVHQPDADFASHFGFTELRVGPKYTFYRCEQPGGGGTVAAAGLNFDIPIGDGHVFQDTGTLSLEPYISVAQSFLRSNYGTFNVLNTIGYSIATDNQRTDYLFDSIHLDYDVGNFHKIYPLIEVNWFHYEGAGNVRDLGFEGRDLFNFGSQGVSGNNTFTMAAGARFKYNEHLQTGLVFEFPISGHHDLIDYRVTFDVIFRY
jgi:hypothetical protein